MPQSRSHSSTLQILGEAGGGQLLRSSLSLSIITGQRFHMTRIRGKRPKPGLMRQHLTAVKAAAATCDAAVDGAELGSTELIFSPGTVRGGDYHFNIGSGGSAVLVLQTLLPPLLYADACSTVTVEGGTHNPMAPPFEFFNQCYLPHLHTMGVKVQASLQRHGFMQAGGGAITAQIDPVQKWHPLTLIDRGGLIANFGLVVHAHLDRSIASREIAEATKLLGWPQDAIDLRDANDSPGPGNAIMLGARFAGTCEISTGIAQVGRSAESIGHAAAKGLRSYLSSSAPVGVHLADQLVLPLALSGRGHFRTLSLSDHTQSNIALIEQFLGARFRQTDLGGGVHEIALD